MCRHVDEVGPYKNFACLLFCSSWLELKAMLVRKNRKVAMKSKRRWRKFWGKEPWAKFRAEYRES